MSTPNNKGRGVLQINAAATRKPAKQAPRLPAPRLRLIIRRLPPGLTDVEFWNTISPEWHIGQGKVDWAAFKSGKISKDLAKPSRPARAYLKVKDSSFLEPLSQHIRATTFQDAKNSSRDPCLVGPPSLEFAPYNKTPGGRARHDGRQGTIDQDPEFIDFLQSLTEPITKPTANGESSEAKTEKVSTTPLVQYIKEKKANKAKEKEAAAVAKANKKSTDAKEAKESKDKATTPSKNEQRSTVIRRSATADAAEKARVAKATQDAMTAINRSVAAMKGKSSTEKPVAATTTTTPAQSSTPQSTPKRERRGDASAAARIIGRDLGLTPKEGRSPRASRNVSTPASTPTLVSTAVSTSTATPKPTDVIPASSQPPQNPSQNKAPAQAPKGPRNLRNATPQQQQQQQQQQPPPSPRPAQPSSTPKSNPKSSNQPPAGGKSAFLKHANPSQGVTEELLRNTFATYGVITRCEIDKKKGLGYIDFTDNESLRKAMAASPVKVGNGSVVVLENRTPYRKVSQGGTRPGTASPAVSAASSPKPSMASLASINEQVTSSSSSPQPSTKQVKALPSKTANTSHPAVTVVKSGGSNNLDTKVIGTSETTSEQSINTNAAPSTTDPPSPAAAQSSSSAVPRGGNRNTGGRGRGGTRGNRDRGGGRGSSRGGNNRGGNANARKSSTSTNATQQESGQQGGGGEGAKAPSVPSNPTGDGG